MYYLADTTIIIGYLRNKPKSIEYINKVLDGEITISISTITEAEVFCGLKKDLSSMLETLAVLSFCKKENVTSNIAREGGKLYRDYGHYMGKSNGEDNEEDKRPLLDAIIAATAKSKNLTLLTENYKHFKQLEKSGHIKCQEYKETA